MNVCTCVYTFMCVNVCMCVHFMCVNVCMCVHVFLHLCENICMCVFVPLCV